MTVRSVFPASSSWLVFVLAIAGLCSVAHAGDRFVSVNWTGLKFENEPPEQPTPESWLMRGRNAEPRVVLDGPGEAYLHFGDSDNGSGSWMEPLTGISLRVEERAALGGRLFVFDEKSGKSVGYHFEVATPDNGVDARQGFYQDMKAHYAGLLDGALPGAAWFRHRLEEARSALGETAATAQRGGRLREAPDIFDLFTGARAIAENLDLDRTLREPKSEDATIDIDSIQGVSTKSYDWKHALEGHDQAELDPLAKLIPADQHAVFFPTFEAMTRVFHEIDAQGTPLMAFFDQHVEDLRTKERYQEQMLLPLTTLGRTLGPAVVSSVAVTGHDPFLPGGTDVVMLFDCKQPAVFEALMAARQAEAEKKGARRLEGEFGAVNTASHSHWVSVATPDAHVSCVVAPFGSVVVVTNSIAGLMGIGAALESPETSLVNAPEYKWFRDRYKRGDPKESALLVLTDATIRRWAGPRSRIGDARRLRAAAVMAEIEARHMDELVAGTIEPGTKAVDAEFPLSADFEWTSRGVFSREWGSLEHLVPIIDLEIGRVSPSEKQAYEAFRSAFQSRWRTYFDPIAIRIEADGNHLRADATVRPLVLDSDYKEIEKWTKDSNLPLNAGDPHAGTLFHLAFGLPPGSELGRMLTGEAGDLMHGFGPDPFSWIGSSISLYAERDPWWQKMRDAISADERGDVDWYAVPVAIQIAVKDPLKLAGFLTALRTLADQSAPNLTKWESRTWQETGYVRIAASEDAGITEPGRDAALYYVSMADALVLSPREDLIKNAIERHKSRKAGATVDGGDRAWLGQSAGLRLDREAIEAIDSLDHGVRPSRAAQAAWSALPILDEWHRRYPTQDPVALHERVWGVRLVAPGGGGFVWNEELQAMESKDFGRPGSVKQPAQGEHALSDIASAELGLTFEEQGLRAVVQIEKAH
jgi:hypothetical protein